MKNIVLAITLFIGSVSFVKAQTDSCNEIKKKHDVEQQQTEFYTTPMSHLELSKNVADDESYSYTSIILFTTKKTADYNATGLYVTFDDGTIWKDEGHTVSCSFESVDVGYSYTGSKLLKTADDILPFKTKKIVKVRISDIEIPIDDAFATKFKAWANCIETIK